MNKKIKAISVWWRIETNGTAEIIGRGDLETAMNDGYHITRVDTIPFAGGNERALRMSSTRIYILEKEDEGMK